MGDDPVKFGRVTSLNRPGGNLTGVSFLAPALEAKRVELLRELVPTAGTIAVLVNRLSGAEGRLRDVREAAGLLGQQFSIVNASSEGDFEVAFANVVQQRAGALIVVSDPFFTSRRDQLTALAAGHRIPAIYHDREFAAAGGLMSMARALLVHTRRSVSIQVAFSRARGQLTFPSYSRPNSNWSSISRPRRS